MVSKTMFFAYIHDKRHEIFFILFLKYILIEEWSKDFNKPILLL